MLSPKLLKCEHSHVWNELVWCNAKNFKRIINFLWPLLISLDSSAEDMLCEFLKKLTLLVDNFDRSNQKQGINVNIFKTFGNKI